MLKSDKSMKNFVLFLFIFIIFSQLVSASVFATIGMKGLSMASPEAAEIINIIICVQNPMVCAGGKIVGTIQSEALGAIAEQSPEIAEAIITYNQIKGYTDLGAEIISELQVNEEGQIESGSIQFSENESSFGNLIGESIKQNEIFGKGISLDINTEEIFGKTVKTSVVTFTGENSYINIKDNLFQNIKAKDGSTEAFLKLDEEGGILEADLTASKATIFKFGGRSIQLNKGSRIVIKDEKTEIFGNKQELIKLQDDSMGLTELKEVKFNGEDGIVIIGNEISGKNFEVNGVKVIEGYEIVDGKKESFVGKIKLLPNGDILVGERTWVEWTKKGIGAYSQKNEILLTENGGSNLIGNYVYAQDRKLTAGGSDFEVYFNEGNPYARVDEGDYFAVGFNYNSKFEIENDVLGKIPKMKTWGQIIIDQDYKSIVYSGDKIVLNKFPRLYHTSETDKSLEYGETTTSPVVISFLDNKGEKILGGFSTGEKGYELLVDNFNRWAVVPDNSGDEFFVIMEGINTKFSSRLRYNYIEPEDIKALTGLNTAKIDLTQITKGTQDMVLGKLRDYYETLTPETKESFTGFVFLNDEDFNRKYGGKEAIMYNTREIVFRANDRFDFVTFRHEAAHTLQLKLKKRWIYDYKKTGVDGYYFEEEWGELVNYNKFAVENFEEDVAYLVEISVTKPEFFKDLINPKSPTYDERDRKKIDLVYKNNFISEAEYQKILTVAGVA